MLYKQLAEILKVHQLKFQKKKCKKLPIKKCPMLFVVGMFSHLSASARDHFAKLQQGSHATSWPVQQAGQTLHLGSSKSWEPESNESNAPFWWREKPLGFWVMRCNKWLPKCPFFWGAAHWDPMKYDWGLLIFSRTSRISSCQHIPKGKGCYFENFTPQKEVYKSLQSQESNKNSHLYLSSGTIFPYIASWFFGIPPHVFFKTTSDVYNFGPIPHWRRVRSVNARCPWCRWRIFSLWHVAKTTQVPLGFTELLCQKVHYPENERKSALKINVHL